MSLEVINLFKKYGDQVAVNKINFEVGKGKILGFLGPNGAGKSTTMKIATGYVKATSGRVLINGLDVSDHSIEVRKQIGYLPEHNPLYLDMYVKEYLTFVGKVHDVPNLKSRLDEIIMLCGLTAEQHKKIEELSKGYRQRVGLAQALIHDPEVLILDEPTTGLDPNQIIEIRELIRKISVDKTVIFSTHIMQEVQALCDHVVIINKGNIVANANVNDLKNNTRNKTLRVTFTELPDKSILEAIEGVQAVNSTIQGNYDLEVEEDIDRVRKEVFRLASEYNWEMVGLTVVENSLEEVFHELTTKND